MISSVAIVQARMGSTRLPGKVVADLGGREVLAWAVETARDSGVDEVVVATSTMAEDEAIVRLGRRLDVPVVRGHPRDVLGRFVAVTSRYPADVIVRLTGDNPLVDADVIRTCLAAFHHGGVDYLSTSLPRSLPRGLDVEVFSADSLNRADAEAVGSDRAHVTSWLYRKPGRAMTAGIVWHPSAADLRVTVDTHQDLEMVRHVVAALGDRSNRRTVLVDFLRGRPDLVAINADVPQKALDEG